MLPKKSTSNVFIAYLEMFMVNKPYFVINLKYLHAFLLQICQYIRIYMYVCACFLTVVSTSGRCNLYPIYFSLFRTGDILWRNWFIIYLPKQFLQSFGLSHSHTWDFWVENLKFFRVSLRSGRTCPRSNKSGEC